MIPLFDKFKAIGQIHQLLLGKDDPGVDARCDVRLHPACPRRAICGVTDRSDGSPAMAEDGESLKQRNHPSFSHLFSCLVFSAV